MKIWVDVKWKDIRVGDEILPGWKFYRWEATCGGE